MRHTRETSICMESFWALLLCSSSETAPFHLDWDSLKVQDCLLEKALQALDDTPLAVLQPVSLGEGCARQCLAGVCLPQCHTAVQRTV